MSIVAAVLAAIALGAPPPALTGPHACPDVVGFTCSTLTVPLDHSGRVGGTLDLSVAIADNTGAPRGVLLFLTGGPGQPGVPAIARISTRIAPLLHDYRLVMVDQRGTGGTALSCPALQAQVGTSDIAVPAPAAVRSCAASLGRRRSFYSTADTVEDLEALRRSLGVARWTIDGVSYGTFVAERYAIAHPSHVKALVLDSVIPHADQRGEISLYAAGLRATARVLRAACRDTGCGTDPAADIAWLVRHGVDGVRLFDLIVEYEFVDPEYSQVIGQIHAARMGDRANLRLFEDQARAAAGAPAALFSAGLHAATLCSDLSFPWGHARAELARAAARLDVWPFTPATAAGNGIVQTCLAWPSVHASAPVARKLPPVPTLLLSGDHDLSTPLEWARAEASLAPHGKLVVVAGASHSIQSRERGDAGRRAAEAFLLS